MQYVHRSRVARCVQGLSEASSTSAAREREAFFFFVLPFAIVPATIIGERTQSVKRRLRAIIKRYVRKNMAHKNTTKERNADTRLSLSYISIATRFCVIFLEDEGCLTV